jgi:hypothetical protein
MINFSSATDHGLITLYSSMSMMGVDGSMLYYNKSGTDILFHNPERVTDTPITSITDTTHGFFHVSSTPSNVDFVMADGKAAGTPSTKYFLASRTGDCIDMMRAPVVLNHQDIIVSTLNKALTDSSLKLTTVQTSMPCAIEDIARFNGTSRSHTNDVRAGTRASIAADVVIDFNPGKCIYKGIAGCMQTWLNRCMDPDAIKPLAAIRREVLDLAVGKTAPELKYEGYSVNSDVIQKIVKIALATYSAEANYTEKYACFKSEVGYSLHAVIYSVFKYAKWTSPRSIAERHKIPAAEQELNKTTARHRLHHICGGNVAISINFTNFFPSVDKRNLANPEQRSFMIEGVKMISIIKAMLDQDESFKKDVALYDSTDGKCAYSYSSAYVIQMPSDATSSASSNPMPVAASVIPRGVSGIPRGGGGVVRGGLTPSLPKKRLQAISTSDEGQEEQEEQEEQEGQEDFEEQELPKKRVIDRSHANLAQKQSIESAPGNVLQLFGDMASGNVPQGLQFPQGGMVVAAAKELQRGDEAFPMINKPGQDALRSATRHYPIAVTQIMEKVVATNGTAGISKPELEKMVNVLLAASYSTCWVRPKNKVLRWPNSMKPVKEKKAEGQKAEGQKAEGQKAEAKKADKPSTSQIVEDITATDDEEQEAGMSKEELFGHDDDGFEDEDDEESSNSAPIPSKQRCRISKRKTGADLNPFVKRQAAAEARAKVCAIQETEGLGSDIDD